MFDFGDVIETLFEFIALTAFMLFCILIAYMWPITFFPLCCYWLTVSDNVKFQRWGLNGFYLYIGFLVFSTIKWRYS